MKKILIFSLSLFIFLFSFSSLALAQGFNVASTYELDDQEAVSGDIIISSSERGLTRTDISYDNRIFGILQEPPLIVLRDATSSASKKAIIRAGDAFVNVTDFNGEIKKGDFVTTSPILGKGMKAGQSGYAVGIATEDVRFTDTTSTIDNKTTRNGTVSVALRIEYAEITTVRNSFRLLNQLNAVFFRNIQDPEKFTLTLRYLIAGIIAILAFGIGFFSVSRSISKSVEGIARNPLAKQSILISVALQLLLTAVVAVVTVVVMYIIVRI